MTNSEIQILLVDDHSILRQGVKALLQDVQGFEVVGEAEDGLAAMAFMEQRSAHVILLDINMPEMSGLELIGKLHEAFPECAVLVFSMHDDDHYIREMLVNGARGYLLKSSSKSELVRAIRTCASGDTYLSQGVSEKLVRQLREQSREQQKNEELGTPLTPREIEVLRHVSSGLTNQEIGEKLFISPRTVDTHRRNIMEKLDLHNAAALTHYAARHGLLDV